MGRAVQQLSKPPLFDGCPDFLYAFVKPVLVTGAYCYIPLLCFCNDGVRIPDRKRHRLFNNQMCPVIQTVQGDCGMFSTFCGYGCQLRPLLFQHFHIIRIDTDTRLPQISLS